MTIESPDPLLEALAQLPARSPATSRDAAVRVRCHALLGAPPARPGGARGRLARTIDAALPIAIGLYGALAVAEAWRLALR